MNGASERRGSTRHRGAWTELAVVWMMKSIGLSDGMDVNEEERKEPGMTPQLGVRANNSAHCWDGEDRKMNRFGDGYQELHRGLQSPR